MSLLSAILALVIEQVRPLAVRTWVTGPLERIATALEGRFNDGQYRHGRLAWLLAVAAPCILVLASDLALWRGGYPLLSFLLGVLSLYLTMGFRQFSHFYTELQLALRMGEIDQARRLLAAWRGQSGDRLNTGEISRLAIEQALIASHRHVFAPLFWFAVLGPAGAVTYRLAMYFDKQWGQRIDPDFGRFGEFAHKAFGWIDWLPVRVSAIGFAIVGDFEDAVMCWRTQAARWSDPPRASCSRVVRVRLVFASVCLSMTVWTSVTGPSWALVTMRILISCKVRWVWSGARWCLDCCCSPCSGWRVGFHSFSGESTWRIKRTSW